MTQYQFTFEGKTYECIGEDKDFQIRQFKFAIEDRQWVTIKNRIINIVLTLNKDLISINYMNS